MGDPGSARQYSDRCGARGIPGARIGSGGYFAGSGRCSGSDGPGSASPFTSIVSLSNG